jgi:hypothetical protein
MREAIQRGKAKKKYKLRKKKTPQLPKLLLQAKENLLIVR